MVSASFFKQSLKISGLSKADFLQKIGSLTGLVYLENQDLPIIGFLPKKYCVYINGGFSQFVRCSDFNYQYESQIYSLKDFVQCSENPLSNSARHYFRGGYIGYYDYNFAANFQINTKVKKQPQLFFGLYESYLIYENNDWVFYSTEHNAKHLYTRLLDCIQQSSPSSFQLSSPIQARWTKQQYRTAFQRVQDYIVAGDCYQINLTQEFVAQAEGELLSIAKPFWALTNAPYAAYLKIDNLELLSCSPELFIEFRPNKKMITKPIKGTMPRFKDSQKDQESKQTLINSEKDKAENLMIVDLLRNDLSIYAETGTVKTPKLFNIESFNQVHHMISEIEATLKSDVHQLDVLHAALPGGSITGAPKIRAMEIIEELEESPRGAYCGSIGYFNFDGTGSWNILIRTIQKYQQDVSIWAGGGVTISSDCDAEYQECFDKVDAMLKLMNQWYES